MSIAAAERSAEAEAAADRAIAMQEAEVKTRARLDAGERLPDISGATKVLQDALAKQNTGSSTFVARAVVLGDPPSLDAREITDKGSINQKAVLQHRADIVEALYGGLSSSTPTGRFHVISCEVSTH